MMVGIDINNFSGFETDLQIVEAMVCEQSVFCLPGKCFNIKDFFRIVLTVPQEMLMEACNRIQVNICNGLNPIRITLYTPRCTAKLIPRMRSLSPRSF
jgi:aspartate/methionine/tyrosine aminotransferase